MTSLTLVRRIEARPSIVFDAVATPEGISSWWGGDDMPVIAAEADVSVGEHFKRASVPQMALSMQNAPVNSSRSASLCESVMSWQWTTGGETRGTKRRLGRVEEFHLRAIVDGD